MMKSAAVLLLHEKPVVLEHFRLTILLFILELPILVIVVGMLCMALFLFVKLILGENFLYALCTPAFMLLLAAMVKDRWQAICERWVTVDPLSKTLTVTCIRFNRMHPEVECIPFKDLLLYRYFRADNENHCAAFELRIQVGKNIHQPYLNGYLLHTEDVASNITYADFISNEIADALVCRLGLAYKDLHSVLPA